MSIEAKPELYHKFIDSLVDMCHNGQGQIGSNRALKGIERLSISDREVLAKLLSDAVETGVFETLKALEEFQISPFESGYEGSPFNDFIGRLNDWDWPNAHSK